MRMRSNLKQANIELLHACATSVQAVTRRRLHCQTGGGEEGRAAAAAAAGAMPHALLLSHSRSWTLSSAVVRVMLQFC